MKKKTIGIFSVLALSLLTVSMVFAYQGNPEIKGPDYSEEKHEAMQEAFDNLDYQAWYDLMIEYGKKGRVLDIIDETNFERFVEMHKAKLNGNIEEAKAIAQELGLGIGGGQGKMNKYVKSHGQAYGEGFKQGFKSGKGNCPCANSE